MNNIEEKIDRAIDTLLKDFDRYPNKYLTEEDVRVHLCLLLMSDFGELQSTEDGDISIALHSEIRWWGSEEKKVRSDIVIFDVSRLSVTRGRFNSKPRKGYSSSKPLAVIELKLRRNVGGGNREFVCKVESDVKKLSEIKTMMRDEYGQDLVCRVIALDKKEQINVRDFGSYQIPLLWYRFSDRSA